MTHVQNNPRQRGFTLLEIIVALTIGLIITAGATALLQGANQSAQLVSRRAGIQGNARGAMNMMTHDLDLSGTGLGSIETISIPDTGTGSTGQRVGCYQNSGSTAITCDLGGAGVLMGSLGTNTTTAGGSTNVLWMVNPMPGSGPVDWTTNNSDAILFLYEDPSINLGVYSLANNSSTGTYFSSVGSFATFNVPSGSPCLDNSATGFQQGDVVMFTGPNGGHALAVVQGFNSVATGIQSTSAASATNLTCNGTGAGSSNQLTFQATDPFNLNQLNTSTVNSLAALIAANGGSAATASTFGALRIAMITYFLYNNGGDLELMRQYGGRAPVPVADNLSQLKITYDVYDTSGSLTVESSSAYDVTTGTADPTYIRKINIVLGVRSTRPMNGGKYDNLTIRTSVSPRDLDYVNLYTGSVTGSTGS